MLKISAEAADRYHSLQGLGRCKNIRETFTIQMRTFKNKDIYQLDFSEVLELTNMH